MLEHIVGEAISTARLKSGANCRNEVTTTSARRDFRPTGAGTNFNLPHSMRRTMFPFPNHRRSSMTIVLGITASIAAYKAADLASQLRKAGCDVHVVMTHGAAKFITALTLQTLSRNPVTTDIFDEKAGWQPGHIDLADRADLLLIAPASADILAKLAHGFADEALTAIALATKAPLLVAPAMNGKMWLHPATQNNVTVLRGRGVEFIGPEEGMLACGYEGIGRLWPAQEIADKALAMLKAR
jgi:phosphopantothenoylcysteine decarboxylase